jgi:hypothetical protein
MTSRCSPQLPLFPTYALIKKKSTLLNSFRQKSSAAGPSSSKRFFLFTAAKPKLCLSNVI